MTEKNSTAVNPTTALLSRLSLAVGVTGYTKDKNSIYQILKAEFTPYTDRVEQDRIGSFIGVKLGAPTSTNGQPRRKIMLAAHLDEIGMMVSHVDRGFLRFQPIGGLDRRVMLGLEVIVHAQRDLPGIIGAVPPHLLTKASHEVKHEDLLIDVGLPADEVEKIVHIGDLVSFTRPPTELLGGALSAKAMDNRASVAALVICLQELSKLRHQWDVYAVATADEEWGLYVGATTQAYAIRPDIAIILDVTFADVSENEVKLNNGPTIALGPYNHPILRERLVKIAKDLELKYQSEIVTAHDGVDIRAIQVSREGVPAVLVGLPSHYMHTPIEVVHPKDVERAGRLVAYFIASLDENFMESLSLL